MRYAEILVLILTVFIGPAVGTSVASTAQYRVTFDSTWNRIDHPYDFPTTSAHFSSLIGGTHNANVTFWQPGGLASVGIEAMAELGHVVELANEVGAAINAGTAFETIRGGGINPSPGMVSTTFQMRDDYPLVTLVSMVAPSPDWFVGVTGMPMRPNGRWLDRAVVDLWPFDAGTDHGVTFTSADIEAEPHVPITQITGFPFAGTPRLGTFTFELLSVSSIPGDANGDNRVDRSDIAILAENLGAASGARFDQGDFNGDGAVSLADLGILNAAVNGGPALSPIAQAVPEPSSLMSLAALVIMVAAGAHRRRRSPRSH